MSPSNVVPGFRGVFASNLLYDLFDARVRIANNISIGSAVFAGPMVVTKKQTERHTHIHTYIQIYIAPKIVKTILRR